MRTLLTPLVLALSVGTLIAQPDTWNPITPLPSAARSHASGFAIDGFGYVACGTASGSVQLADLWRYDPVADNWEQRADFPGDPRSGAIAFTVGGKGYLCFGLTDIGEVAEVWCYDPVADSWEQKADFPGGERSGAMTFTIEGTAYVGMGFQGGAGQGPNDLWAYDPGTDTWAQKADYPGMGRGWLLAFGVNGTGYAGCGGESLSYYDDFYAYDPGGDAWEQRTDYAGGTESYTVSLVANGLGYVVCGNTNSEELWSYAPSGSWTQLTSYPDPPGPNSAPRFAAGFSIGNRLYVGTGSDGSSGVLNTFEVYQPLCDPPTAVSVTNDGPVCGQGLVDMSVTASGTEPFSYQWTGSLIQTEISLDTISALQVVQGDQVYWVTVTNACGTASGTTTVTMTDPPMGSFNYNYLELPTTWCLDDGIVGVQNTYNWIGGGTFSSTDGAVVDAETGEVDATASGAGSYSVIYDLPAQGGCDAYSTTGYISFAPLVTWYNDQDQDGYGDPEQSTVACEAPFQHVLNADDLCPIDQDKIAPGSCGCGNPEPGTACDDLDPETDNDVITEACVCAGGAGCVPPSDLVVTNDGPICGQGEVAMSVAGLGTGPFTYAWSGLLIQGDNTLQDISALQVSAGDQIYSVTVTNACGTASGETTVTMTEPPMGQFNYNYLGMPTSWCTIGGDVSIQNVYNWVSGGVYFSPNGAVVDEETGVVDADATGAGSFTIYYYLPAQGGCDEYYTGAGISLIAPNIWYNDQDGDGFGDPATAVTECEQPFGTVGNGDDQCPIDPDKIEPGSCGCGYAEPGTACDDLDPDTDNDVITEACICAGGGACVPPSDLVITNDGPICGQGEVAMSVTSLGTGPFDYAWTGLLIQTDPALQDISALQVVAGDQVYSVTVSNACGTVSGETTVTMTEPPISSFDYSYLGMPTSWCTDQGPVSVQNLYNWVGGGTFSSADGAVVDEETGVVDATASGAGDPSVTYYLPAQGGCPEYSTTAFISLVDPQLWYADQDGDGAGDPDLAQLECEQPFATVNNGDDLCPFDNLKIEPGVCGCGNLEPGAPCDDGNEVTINDVVGTDCICIGEGPQAITTSTAHDDRVRYDRPNGTIYVREDARTPVALIDATGRIVSQASGPVARFNVAPLPMGLYFIRASGLSQRVVVE